MFTFQDTRGCEWSCYLTMETAVRLSRWDFSAIYSRPVSLYALDEQLLQDLTVNAGLVMALVYAINKPLIDERFADTPESSTDGGPSPRELRFLQGIDGETIENARTALFGGLAHFFPGKKTSISTALSQPRMAEAEMEAQLQARSPEVAALIRQKGNEYLDHLLTKLQNTNVETFLKDGKGF